MFKLGHTALFCFVFIQVSHVNICEGVTAEFKQVLPF